MSWTKLDDLWTENQALADLSFAVRWHYLAMIQFCSRAELYNGVMRQVDARRCSDHPDPDEAVRQLINAGFLERMGDKIRLLRIEDHVPDSSIRKKTEQAKLRKRRERAHKAGDHSMCTPGHCPDAPPATDAMSRSSAPSSRGSHADVTRDVTPNVTRDVGTGQDGTGRALDEDTSTTSAEHADTAFGWDVAEIPTGDTAGLEQVDHDTGEMFQSPRACKVGMCSNPPLPGLEECAEHVPSGDALESERARQSAALADLMRQDDEAA
jgi:hypothetical protein